MSAEVMKPPGKVRPKGPVADDIARHAWTPWEELFSWSREEVEAFQLKAAQRRFEELKPQIAALSDQADQHGITRLETLSDIIPLLFDHAAYKSYPISLLEKSRFDMLTRWLQRVTSIDLSGVDVSKVTGIDDWMDTLEASVPLQIYNTTGTSGKISFIPRTTLEASLWNAAHISGWQTGYGNVPGAKLGGADGARMPVIYPSVRYGRYTAQHMIQFLADHLAPTPDDVYTLSNGTLSADLMSLSGRIRIAQAKGELSKMQLTDGQRLALKRYLEELDRRPQEMADFFRTLMDKLQGERVFISCPATYMYQAAAKGLAQDIRGVFAANSLGFTGGGGKDVVLPPTWLEDVTEFTGFNWRMLYGMTELISFTLSCDHGRFHLTPVIVPFILDPLTGAELPREGTQTGRFAALDLLAQTYWGGIVTGDMVTVEWDTECPCGRKGAFLHNHIERYSTNVTGDDKITCAATVDNTDAALQKLLAI